MGGYNRCFIRYMCVTGAKQVAGGKAYKFGEHFIIESSISIMELTLCSRICWQDLLWHSTSRGFRRNRGDRPGCIRGAVFELPIGYYA